MKKAVIIGANGFLGSQLVLSLAKRCVSVIALVSKDLDYSFLSDKTNIHCIEFDLANLNLLYDKSCFYNADIIFHMAWAGVDSSYRNEARVQAQNIIYSLSVLQLARHFDIKRILMPGSAAEVSCGKGVITGTELPAPSDLYSASKVATRFLCQAYASQHKLELIWTLITSVYGPKRNDRNLISYTIKKLLSGECPSFTCLEQEWDYLYIDDLIEALIALGEKGIGGKIYPIGSGKHRKLLDYILIIRDCIDPALPLGIGELPYKNKIIDNQIIDITELKRDTNFTPFFTFEKGIENTIEYFKLTKE